MTKYPVWDSILADMLFQPPDVVIISAKRRGRGHGGWSKNNPYLEEVRYASLRVHAETNKVPSRLWAFYIDENH